MFVEIGYVLALIFGCAAVSVIPAIAVYCYMKDRQTREIEQIKSDAKMRSRSPYDYDIEEMRGE